MSGLEVVALVAGIVSAFSGATSLYRNWRKERRERREKEDNERLETLVRTSGPSIHDEYDRDFRRLGQVFARGDETGRVVLMEQLITLQSTLIVLLNERQPVDIFAQALHPHHGDIQSTSAAVRDRSLSALGEQFQRMSQAAPISRIQPLPAYHKARLSVPVRQVNDDWARGDATKMNVNTGDSSWQTMKIFRLSDSGLRTHSPSAAFSSDGKILAMSRDMVIKTWNTVKCQVSTFAEHSNHGRLYVSKYSPNGESLLCIHRSIDKYETIVYNTASKQIRFRVPSTSLCGTAFSPDSKLLATTGGKGISLWNAVTGEACGTFGNEADSSSAVAFSPDGSLLAGLGGTSSGELQLWNTATRRVHVTLKTSISGIWNVVFSSDGKQLALASKEATVHLCTTATGQVSMVLRGHTAPVCGLAYSPDGKLLASASGDCTVRLWDVATGQLRAILEGHTGPVWSVAFSPCGETIASASCDGTVRLWNRMTGRSTPEVIELD